MSQSNLTLEVLICTLDKGIKNVRAKMLPQLAQAKVLISHQYTDSTFIDTGDWPPNVRYVTLEGKGLSRNRNHALEHATGDVILLADDDLVYEPNFTETILHAYIEHKDAVAITFQAVGMERWTEPFVHNWRTVGQVSSIAVTCRLSFIRERCVVFDTRFGLGGQYPQGEENIFLADIRKAGGQVFARPEVIVQHVAASSGFVFTPERVTAKIATVRRMYGWLAALATLLIFTVTKHHLYKKSNISPWQFFFYGIKGLRAKFL